VELSEGTCAYEYARTLERKAGLPSSEDRGLLNEALCSRCTHGVVFRRRYGLELTVHCAAMRRDVPPDVAECNQFQRPDGLDLDRMVEMALAIDLHDGFNVKSYL